MICEFCNEVYAQRKEYGHWDTPKSMMTAELMYLVKRHDVVNIKYTEPDILKVEGLSGQWFVYRIVGKCLMRDMYHLEWVD